MHYIKIVSEYDQEIPQSHSVALPNCVVGWSAVCDCGIS